MALHTLFLVRHGQYLANTPPGEEADGSLTELGQEQCALLARRLTNHKILKIFHSPLIRAVETAALIAQEFPGITVNPDPLLVECIPAVPPDSMLSPAQKEFFVNFTGNEVEEHALQARQAYEKYFRPVEGDEDINEILVSHGNLISYFTSQVFQAPPATWIKTDIMNAGLCEIFIRADGLMRLVSHNDTGHLPFGKKSWT